MIKSILFSVISFVALVSAQEAVITPTCDSINIQGSNDCGLACRELGQEIDFRRSRDVNGKFKCYCTTLTVCNDDPVCSDLLVIPGAAQERCQTVCGEGSTAQAQDDVEYAGEGANRNQTHFRVNCFCNDVQQCDTEYILFSDLSFLPACSSSSDDPGTLNIDSEADCVAYCTDNTFEGAIFDGAVTSCNCTNTGGTAVACDDSKANSQRPDGIGCFEEVGVSTVTCPPTPAPTTESGSFRHSSKTAIHVPLGFSVIHLSVWMLQ
ncbi:hypothetical protein IV203_012677 [Nitzschia inconspicua]|uniref:Uncharacterized protein n=1 Tax=Nitzschia inconspicua TaxID=303405 RepID=A0A9K3PJZ7_9STRA|nr:hypothetical protein IV203_014264 [Nitzschia inconspicua]KAG7350080.1 hypothetical protein IV203_012677 [Nitzschia inconspicua]